LLERDEGVTTKVIENLATNKALWMLIASMALIAACIGGFNQDIYSKVVSTDLLSGAIAQDVVTILAGIMESMYLNEFTICCTCCIW
jgi:hypothetical protein